MKRILAGVIAVAVTAFAAYGQESSPPQEQTPYRPSISDIMVRQQMRHIKLWFAGRDGNWPLADYEVDALKGGFDDLNELLGGKTVEEAVGAALSALEKAVDAKDRSAFPSAFDELTAGCNSCHRTLGHQFIVIERPVSLPYSDQSFAAPK